MYLLRHIARILAMQMNICGLHSRHNLDLYNETFIKQFDIIVRNRKNDARDRKTIIFQKAVLNVFLIFQELTDRTSFKVQKRCWYINTKDQLHWIFRKASIDIKGKISKS